ncbi:hypothetical protein [Mycolicibacterium vinylchloridicum]|uniref:hypothetical protein n=1 Tax=Mycolicibacterium vinylchloridicum TaxID=2736928 RepID=UPI0015C98F62|nr:hypothetical protein [Mycolicibacterium vinylchloridicum]
MRRGACAIAAVAVVIGIAGTACSNSDSKSGTGSASPASSAAPVATDKLPGLVPTPANSQETKGPNNIADGGIHLFFKVDGPPNDVMTAYKAALQDKGWSVTTMVTSGGDGGGGATYTGTKDSAYGVFDGGGYNTNTFLDVCVWPAKPENPTCSRGDR